MQWQRRARVGARKCADGWSHRFADISLLECFKEKHKANPVYVRLAEARIEELNSSRWSLLPTQGTCASRRGAGTQERRRQGKGCEFGTDIGATARQDDIVPSRVVFVDETGPKDKRSKRIAIMDPDGTNMHLGIRVFYTVRMIGAPGRGWRASEGVIRRRYCRGHERLEHGSGAPRLMPRLRAAGRRLPGPPRPRARRHG
jgi:hypothetical protein